MGRDWKSHPPEWKMRHPAAFPGKGFEREAGGMRAGRPRSDKGDAEGLREGGTLRRSGSSRGCGCGGGRGR